jgi:ribosomal protein S18 acetylase RimI-like enzyme
MITYQDSAEAVTAAQLTGFFAGWPNPPSPENHLRILRGSDFVLLARDEKTGHIVGFITAITDGVSVAYLPHLEVLTEYQGQGIGSELVRRMLARISHLYGIDLLCDTEVQPFYERLGLRRMTGMAMRNYERQACIPSTTD